jgi:hypothetical protein
MADNDVVERAMVTNGYTINKHGGAFRWGVARLLEDKARVALDDQSRRDGALRAIGIPARCPPPTRILFHGANRPAHHR